MKRLLPYPASIRVRFLLISAITVGLALALTAALLVSLFSSNISKRIEDELGGYVKSLAGAISFDTNGNVNRPKGPVDQRFNEPYGGLYWQIVDDSRAQTIRSQSLWDTKLDLPEDAHTDGSIHHYLLPGPDGSQLIVQERMIRVAAPEGPRALRLAVAVDEATLGEARSAFLRDIAPALAILALFLIGGSIVQLAFGLRSLTSLKEGIDRIRERRDLKLSGTYPSEFESTVTAVNQLIETQSQMIDKARSRAADLAHGLRTPLTVLSNDALTLRDKGEIAMADELDHLAEVMRSHVERELALSRLAARPELRRSDTDIDSAISEIIRTLKRTPQGETLKFIVEGRSPLSVPVDPHDFRELAGNLLENAVKWASHTVSVRWASKGGETVLCIADDGPGVPEDQIANLTRRGWRLDSSLPGSGLGLSIVREIADIYTLGFIVENSKAKEQGTGLTVTLTFPGGNEPY